MNQGSQIDLLIKGGSLLPSPNVEKFIPLGWLTIQNDRISAVGSGPPPPVIARRNIDASGCLVMPGLINGHTHSPMSLFRGLADDLPLKSWLEEHMFPAEKKWVNEEFVYWGTLLACAEMIRSGTTTFADGYFFEDQVAKAVEKSGMRALLGEGILDFPSPDADSPDQALNRMEDFLRQYKSSPLIQPTLFPHTVYTCSPLLLNRCRDLAERYGIPMVIHLAETKNEVEEVLRKYGQTPVRHLENLGLLSSSLMACHCVWVKEEERDLLARRGVKVIHNPESNMKLASGVAPIPELLARGIPVGLGTDGCVSNNNLDLFQEMDSCAKLHKVHRLDPTVMPSSAVLAMATLEGAKALGLEKEIGSLEAGKKADIAILNLNRPHLQPIYNIVSLLVYSAVGADVRDVIINGKLVMQDRQLLTLDEEQILRQARAWNQKIAGP